MNYYEISKVQLEFNDNYAHFAFKGKSTEG